MQIFEDNLTGKKIAEFLREHLKDMNKITPSESVHALDLEALRAADITKKAGGRGQRAEGRKY